MYKTVKMIMKIMHRPFELEFKILEKPKDRKNRVLKDWRPKGGKGRASIIPLSCTTTYCGLGLKLM